MLRSLLISLALLSPAAAQELPSKLPSFAELAPVIESLQKIPTFTEVETMRDTLAQAIDAKNCEQVISFGDSFATSAAVVIAVAREGLAPAMGLPPSASANLPSTEASRYVGERIGDFIVLRGLALLSVGDCYANSGSQAMAIRYYIQALNAIPAKETKLWSRATTSLWSQLGALPQP